MTGTRSGHASAAETVLAALAAGRTALTEVEAKRVLGDLGVPVSRPEIATTPAEAVAAAGRTGYPVVLKVVAEAITHKSEHGCVALGIRDEQGVRIAFDAVTANARAAFPDVVPDGVAVEAMALPGLEVIVGLQRDPTFGPTVVFGLGGTLVELLADVSMRVVPFTAGDATAMIDEIRGARLLRGYRDQPPRDVAAVARIVRQVGTLGAVDGIAAVDLNPVIVYERGVLVVDALITLRGDAA